MESSEHGYVRCSKCGFPQPPETYNEAGYSVCPHCNSRLRINVFPALYETPGAPAHAPPAEVQGGAGCFYHPDKPAVVPCGTCGRYLCALCSIDLQGEVICPVCMERAASDEEVTELVTRRVLYDKLAFFLAVVPVLFWFVSIVTAPIAIYLSIRHWRTPLSILPRRRVRFVMAFLLASVQVVIWTVVLLGLFS